MHKATSEKTLLTDKNKPSKFKKVIFVDVMKFDADGAFNIL
jgi:hypothetical protein